MTSFVLAFYGILIFACLFATLFVVFHLARYSLNKANASVVIGVFLIVTGILTVSNIVLFLAVPWGTMFSDIFATAL